MTTVTSHSVAVTSYYVTVTSPFVSTVAGPVYVVPYGTSLVSCRAPGHPESRPWIARSLLELFFGFPGHFEVRPVGCQVIMGIDLWAGRSV